MTGVLSKKLEQISSQLDALRFVGFDQNPHAIRDELSVAIFKVKKLEEALEKISLEFDGRGSSHMICYDCNSKHEIAKKALGALE